MKRATAAASAVMIGLLVGACGGSSHQSSGSGNQPAASSQFVRAIDNPWFPLRPGSVYRYTGVKDGKPTTETVRVTRQTKTIAGVVTTAVDDRLYWHGKPVEITTDWYAQDRRGNVWYFGENTKELDLRGRVTSKEGTWRAGVNGAKQGLYMPAQPRVGQSARQEYLRGHAEDHFRVMSVGRRLETVEWTPLEPGVLDSKVYRRGVGTVLERTLKGGDERNTLVSFSHG